MRDLMVLAGVLVLVPLALMDVFAAYLIWGWTSVIAIDSYVYGFARDFRLNLVFALLTLAVLLVSRDATRSKLEWNRTSVILVLLIIQATATAIFALPGNPLNFDIYEKLMKVMVFVLIMPILVNSRERLHAMVVMICLGLAFHGLLDGLKFFASGGSHIVRGLLKFGDNNHYAALMVMVIPLLIYLVLNFKSRLARYAALGAALLMVGAVIGTHSRGGFIGLSVVGMFLLLATRKKMLAMFVVIIGMAIVVNFAPQSWTDRMGTIQEANQDSSFMGRVQAWQVSSAIALGNPILGGGFHSLQVQSVWSEYRKRIGLLDWIQGLEIQERMAASHSIYFEVLGDMGIVGFLIFMALMINALKTAREVTRLAKAAGPPLQWASDMARMLRLSVIVFLVTGAAVSIAYYEIIYLLVMLIEVLKRTVISATCAMSSQAIAAHA